MRSEEEVLYCSLLAGGEQVVSFFVFIFVFFFIYIFLNTYLIIQSFKKLVSMIEETGQTRNNVLNLDAKIEQIQLRTNSLNTERVEKDLAEVREENQTLQAKLKKQGVA